MHIILLTYPIRCVLFEKEGSFTQLEGGIRNEDASPIYYYARGGAFLIASMNLYAGPREEYMKERLAKQKRIEEVQMMDLGIDSPPVVDRNAMGPIGHHTERSAEKQFTIYSYPKYYFANDGTLQLTDINLQPSKKEDIAYEMESAVYRFYACPDGSYWVFHYGMWMYFYIKDIAYMESSTGKLHSLGWKRSVSEPLVEPRAIEWPEIFSGVGLKIELSEDFIKESVLLTDEARKNLPDPKEFDLAPENTDIVLVYDAVFDECCDDYQFPDFDLREYYEMADGQGTRAKSDNFAIDGELTFSRNGIVRHKFRRDEALLPGYIDRDQTPELRTEVKKYWQNTKDGGTLLAYGIPYSIHQKAGRGTIDIDPTITFKEGLYSYSGSYMTQIRGDAGFTDYNYGRDTMLKIGDNSSGVKWRSLVKFDLSDISYITANNIEYASVNLKFRSYLGTLVTRDAKAYQILTDWNEGNSAQGETPATGEATWDEAKYNQTSWSTPGCDDTTNDRKSTEDWTCSLSTTVGNWNEWRITNSVKSWLASGLSDNYGVLLKPDWANSYPEFAHFSDDDATASYRPYLTISLLHDYGFPWSNEGFEWLGDEEDVVDGIVFKKNGIPTTTWNSGDEITMEWTLTTNHWEGSYIYGQYVRMWIDMNNDDVMDAADEVVLSASNNVINPYTKETNSVEPECEVEGNIADRYDVPTYADTRSYTFIYHFTVPTWDPPAQLLTTARIWLRYAGWPYDDPTIDLDFDDCATAYGDYEDYDITINP